MAKQRLTFVCSECGGVFHRWSGRCPNCREWDTLEQQQAESTSATPFGDVTAADSVRIADVEVERRKRISAGIPEFDRVLGGGILPGSTILLGGAPGIGKSTVLLQALGNLVAKGVPCRYVSCEESLGQIKMRADRLGMGNSELSVAAATDLGAILPMCGEDGTRVLVVDSIQRVNAGDVSSAPGSLKQLSVSAAALTESCKRTGCALFLVGHVTKQGFIAGPRALEHLVDTVLYFESENFHALRILRAVKNRFGAVDEVGVFEMTEDGLREVTNPSELFLAERDATVSGSVVTAALEGSRALLLEVQALVGPGAYGTPERKVSGLDYRRFSMLLSVLERQAGLGLARCDAFVNVPGGLQIAEPATDLPLCLAVASSLSGKPFPADAVAVGEVGLGGEVRAVSRMPERLKEAARLGFRRAIVPDGNAAAGRRLATGVHAVRNLRDALRILNEKS